MATFRRQNQRIMIRFFAFIAAIVTLAAAAPSIIAQTPTGYSVRVIDGDTIELSGTRYRIWGIAAPDGPEDAKNRATAAMVQIVEAGQVACFPTGKRSYNRVVAMCQNPAGDIARQLVNLGYAYDWPSYSNGAYADVENSAKVAGRGLWQLGYKRTNNPNQLTK